jgi:AraC-like DNA-binding protein
MLSVTHWLRVSDVAYACGFNEISYFNRCFRRRFGASPSQYRNGKAEPSEAGGPAGADLAEEGGLVK